MKLNKCCKLEKGTHIPGCRNLRKFYKQGDRIMESSTHPEWNIVFKILRREPTALYKLTQRYNWKLMQLKGIKAQLSIISREHMLPASREHLLKDIDWLIHRTKKRYEEEKLKLNTPRLTAPAT